MCRQVNGAGATFAAERACTTRAPPVAQTMLTRLSMGSEQVGIQEQIDFYDSLHRDPLPPPGVMPAGGWRDPNVIDMSPATQEATRKEYGAKGYTVPEFEKVWAARKAAAWRQHERQPHTQIEAYNLFVAEQEKKNHPSTFQAVGKTISSQAVTPPVKLQEVDWYRDDGCPFARMQDAIREHLIFSNKDEQGHYVIHSKHIWLRVPPITTFKLPSTRDALNKKIEEVRTIKARDDELCYGKNIHQMHSIAVGNGYFLSEQHAVWAMGASARTGGLVPPEFFAEVEVNGGTAGNGPEVLDFTLRYKGLKWDPELGGKPGEPLSTIAMAHDTDWLIGRLFEIGPLEGLHRWGYDKLTFKKTCEYADSGRGLYQVSNQSLAALGSAGLFDAAFIRSLKPEEGDQDIQPRATDEGRSEDNPGRVQGLKKRRAEAAASDQAFRETRQLIDDFLDKVAHKHREPDSMFLNQGPSGPGWRVKFSTKDNYAKFGNAVKFGSLIGNVSALRTQDYLFDTFVPGVAGETVVRDTNMAMSPGFPKGK